MQGQTLKYFCERYVCRVCRSNFTARRDPVTGKWSIICTENAEHYGAWSKGYLEHRQQQERVEFLEIIYDHELRQLLPWLPEPSPMTADEAMKDLFG